MSEANESEEVPSRGEARRPGDRTGLPGRLLVLALFATGLAAAQEPIAPAVEQADDAEVPPTIRPPAPSPPAEPMLPSTPLPAGTATMLLPPPPGWRYQVVAAPPTAEKQWGLFAAGIVTFSVAWTANLQAGIPTGQVFLDVPLIGPLLEIWQIPSSQDPFVGFVDFMLVTDAAVQIAGLAMMIAGATTNKKKPGRQHIELVPLGPGAAIHGSF